MKNPNEGMRVALLEVALAATAAPFYFGRYEIPLSTSQAEGAARTPTNNGTNASSRTATGGKKKKTHLPEGRSMYQFEDAGFSTANNPCGELFREIQDHHGENMPVLVSIGTARPRDKNQGEGALILIRRGLNLLGDPGVVHEQMEQHEENGKCFYYRLNDDEGGVKIEMDEWKPKKDGSDTREKMRQHFDTWLQREGVKDRFTECAEHLVRLRRIRTTTPRWERFALVQYFVCQVANCPKDRDNQWLDKGDFESHLRREHRVEDYEGSLDQAVDNCRRQWRYKARATSS